VVNVNDVISASRNEVRLHRELDSTIAGLVTLFTETLTLESRFVNAEERLAEVTAARGAIERARRAQSHDLAQGGTKQARLQFELEAATKAKGEAIRVAIAKLSEYIDAKTRYN
jgi:hypothetical protein